MLDTSKGITPVIAIVLLLLVTVGAVGVVYTQFQSLVGDGPDTSFLDAQSINLDFRTLTRDTSGGTDRIELNLINNDDQDFTFNQSENAAGTAVELQYSSAGEQKVDPDIYGDLSYDGSAYNCNTTVSTISPGDEPTCNTGMEMPSSGNSVTVHLVLSSSGDDIATYTCEPSTSDSNTC
jgi:FlaG/FlaF family flagellin (archaellin)